MDVDLDAVAGSGPGGRVLGREGPDTRIALPPLPDFSRWGEVSREPLRGLRRVTNVGGSGGAHFTPIINYPEAAILGVGAMREVPALVRDEAGEQRLAARLELPLIVAFDHRLNDGMDASAFANVIADALSDPERMLLAA